MKSKNIKDISVFIPAAGLGTRLRPMTNVLPKEMFPIGRKPLLQRTIENCKKAGFTKIVIALAKGEKTSKHIQEYFKNGSKFGVRIKYVYAPPTGIDKAFHAGEKLLVGKPFLFLAGDMFAAEYTVYKELLSTFRKYGNGVLVLRKEKKENVHRFAMAKFSKKKGRLVVIDRLVEKPQARSTPSLFASVGTMIVPESFYEHFKSDNKEIHLSVALNSIFKQEQFFGHITNVTIFDCSDLHEWINANKYIVS